MIMLESPCQPGRPTHSLSQSCRHTIRYIVPSLGGDPVWSSELPGENDQISWSASSEYLIFTNTQDNYVRIYIVAIDDPEPAPMLPDPDNYQGRFSPNVK